MEKMGRTLNFVSLLTILVLVIAIFPIKSYGYYILLRWICCPCLLIITNVYRKLNKNNFSIIFFLLSLIYNPILPLHLGRTIWSIINIVSILTLVLINFLLKKSNIDN